MEERLFLDTSAIVALLQQEEGWQALAKRLNHAQSVHCSAIVILEAVMRLSTIRGVAPPVAERSVRAFLSGVDAELLDVGGRTATHAVRAFEAFGKGRHPARLNFGDCFSYACAKQAGLTLLYKGDDFAQTDLG